MNQHASRPWFLNPALRFYGTGDGQWTVELDDRNGHTLRLSVSNDAFELLQRFREPASWSDVQNELRVVGVDSSRLSSIERFLSESCLARKILIHPEDDIHALAQPTKPSYIGFMLELIPPWLVNHLAAVLRPLFSVPMTTLGVLVAVAGFGFMLYAMHAIDEMPALSALQTLHVFGICGLGVLLHEVGHATAAHRLGARRVGIGVGWYTVMPVAYANLSEIWRHPPRDRVIVDVAGVYMQGLLIAALMVLYQLWMSPVFLVAAAATAMSMLWNLNPLLRMDGYWIAADAFGVSDLRQRAARQLNQAALHLLRGQAPSEPRESPFIVLYGLLSALFFFVLLTRAVAFLAGTLVVSLPQAAQRIDSSTMSTLTVPEWILIIVGVTWNVIFVCFVLRLLTSLPRRIAAWRSEVPRASA